MKIIAGGMALALAGCGTGPSDRADVVQYQFALAAFGSDTTPERVRWYDCVVSGLFHVSAPVEPSGTVHFPVRVDRRLSEQRGSHSELTSADSTISDAVLVYSGLGRDSLAFTLEAGPYLLTLGPEAAAPLQAGEYIAPWSCGVEVPLAHDSTLGAYGYDPNLQIPGTLRITEIRPIE